MPIYIVMQLVLIAVNFAQLETMRGMWEMEWIIVVV